MKFIPQNGYMLVKSIFTSQTESGIILEGELDKDYQISKCIVLESGEDSKYNPGDTVFFSKLVPDDVLDKSIVKQYDLKEKERVWFVNERDIKLLIKK